jgi:hypothetical protein
MFRVRSMLALLVMPLCGFTCVSISSLTVKTAPSDIGYASIESLAADFNQVSRAVGDWARQNQFVEQVCSSGSRGYTPLCRDFVDLNSVRVTVAFAPSSNLTNITITDWSNGKYLSKVSLSLKDHLSRALPSLIIKDD